jgi:hypothetical protein
MKYFVVLFLIGRRQKYCIWHRTAIFPSPKGIESRRLLPLSVVRCGGEFLFVF